LSLDHLGQDTVGRANDTSIDGDQLTAADPLDHPFLQEPKQLDLERQGHVGDLIEKYRSALGELELADRLASRRR